MIGLNLLVNAELSRGPCEGTLVAERRYTRSSLSITVLFYKQVVVTSPQLFSKGMRSQSRREPLSQEVEVISLAAQRL